MLSTLNNVSHCKPDCGVHLPVDQTDEFHVYTAQLRCRGLFWSLFDPFTLLQLFIWFDTLNIGAGASGSMRSNNAKEKPEIQPGLLDFFNFFFLVLCFSILTMILYNHESGNKKFINIFNLLFTASFCNNKYVCYFSIFCFPL